MKKEDIGYFETFDVSTFRGVVNKKPKHKTPVYSPPALIRFEECAHAGATPWSVKRDTTGCEIYLWSPQKRKEQGLTW